MGRFAVVVALMFGCSQPVKREPLPPPPTPDAAIVEAPPRPARQVFAVAPSPTSLVIVGDALVWTDGMGSIWTMPTTGGEPRQLSDQKRPDFAFKVTAAGTAVVASSRKDLLLVDLAGGSVAKAHIRGLVEYPEEIIADGAFVYLTMFKQSKIMRVPAGGGTAQPLGDLARGVLALRGDTLYAVSYATGVLVAIPAAGGKPRTIAKGLVRPTALAVDATHAFVYTEKERVIRKIDLATGKASVLASNLTNSDELVLDGAWLYTRSWDRGSVGSLVRIRTDGSGGSEVIGTDLAAPYGIAFDDDAIYVSARDGAQIVRFDKAALPAR